ncbi:hypothetical protein JK386_13200 [Nocardioides sp. zg-536]|uniref:Uncharacterized protein n=1 Tax=Nocardioides faecalis TaxID=2803858 RepID=A0A939BZA8_9ACTN|nr:hypothetical protein [Nocardioides faecalis]MBM9460855.1 hypothetical protein [Nocardioides faecalis]MBS4751830.1 hypothetical protein [Nocardioides faecalis]QVI59312.1 hypothetical protein KG111_02765 [Nocardioides faecalis]
MTEENAADRQAAQQSREQGKKYPEESGQAAGTGSDMGAEPESAAAVTPDTQRADPQQGIEDSPFDGEAARGQSKVFSDDAGTEDEPKPQGHADEDEAVR